MVIPRGHRPSQEALRAAEGTIARYGIRDSTSISDMVNDRALKSGGILTVVAVLWWLTVYRQGISSHRNLLRSRIRLSLLAHTAVGVRGLGLELRRSGAERSGRA